MTNKSSLKITVIIPNYNHGHLIEDCINALKEQDFRDFEVLIIDDQSTDNSVEIISKLIVDDSRFSLQVLEEKYGLIDLQNLVLANIESEYLLLAAADDFILPRFFSTLLGILENNQEIAFATSKCLIPVSHDRFVSRPIFYEKTYLKVFTKEEAAQQLLKTDFLYITGASLIRTKVFKSVGILERELGALADGVHLRILAATYGYAFVNQYGLVWRRSVDGISISDLQEKEKLSAKLKAAQAILEKCPTIDKRYGQKYVRRLEFVSKINRGLQMSTRTHRMVGKKASINIVWPILTFLYYLKTRPFGILALPRLLRSQCRLSYSSEGLNTSAKRFFNA